MITVLTGGTGGAKFVDGLRQIVRSGRTDNHREYRRRLALVGLVCFARPRFHHCTCWPEN